MPDRETVITHLQIISTWASFARERDLQFFTAKHLEDIAQWADDAIALLKEQKAEIERLKRPDCEHAEHDGAGCLGYCGCEQDDEPIDACKQCEKYTGNICAEY